MARKPRTEAQERTARENLSKANSLAFTKSKQPPAADPEKPPAEKPRTYRAPPRSGKPSQQKSPASSRKDPSPTVVETPPDPQPQKATKQGGLKSALDDLIGSIFQ